MNLINYTRVLDHIKAHPETHDQTLWHCETSHCFAGHAQIMAGHAPDEARCKTQATDWLELTGWQAHYLCKGTRTLQDFIDWQGMTDAQQCITLVNADGGSVKHLPSDLRTPAVCLAAVNADGYAVEHLTREQRTLAVRRAVARQPGNAIKYLTSARRGG